MSTLELATKRAVMASSLVERVVFGDPVITVRRSSDGHSEPALREEGDCWLRLSADFEPGPADTFELLLDGTLVRVLQTQDLSGHEGTVSIEWTFDVATSPVTA